MEIEEIESWYDEQKEICLNDYIKDIQDNVDRKISEKKYETRLAKIIEKYNRLMNEKLAPKKQGKIEKVFDDIKKAMHAKK